MDTNTSAGPIVDDRSIPEWFHPIRGAALALIQNRAYPLWERLFLLGIFSRRLDSIAAGELLQTIPAFLPEFAAGLASGAPRKAMGNLPFDPPLQLDAVLRLAGMMLHRSNVRPRFVECIQAFTSGIGSGPGATLESLTVHFGVAHDRYFAPFFARHPYILENYLINSILKLRYPLGCEPDRPDARLSIFQQFTRLTAQFVLIKGLLIGVAGCHREAFSPAHVVHTVQAASKHFDHHPEFLSLACSLLAESQLDGVRGIAILLRNQSPKAPHVQPQPPALVQLPSRSEIRV
jgi:lysine-N-methylase